MSSPPGTPAPAALRGDYWAAVLMLDLHGYSKLRKWSFQGWMDGALPEIDTILTACRACYKNTWGDGIIAVFTAERPATQKSPPGCDPTPARAAAVAARRVHRYCRTEEFGDTLGVEREGRVPRVRTALHYGRVTFGHDAVRGGLGCAGEAINLCARVEPVVRPGDVLCTREFFVQLPDGPTRRKCFIHPPIELAKGAGERVLYSLITPPDGELGYTLPDGVELRGEFRRPLPEQEGYPGEVFAIELLTETVEITRPDGVPHVRIDRRRADERVLISNAGKQHLFATYLPRDDRGRAELHREDDEIQRVMLGGADARSIPFDGHVRDGHPRPRRLRWASGGVVSVVKFRGRWWVPMFHRDIRPYGWNIALGSTERVFRPDGRPSRPVEHDWKRPRRSGLREFLEETLVVARGSAGSGPRVCRPLWKFQDAQGLGDQPDRHESKEYGSKHRELRKKHDGLDLPPVPDLEVPVVKLLPGNVTLTVISGPDESDVTENVLVAFALTDLGVEVVTALEYALGDDDELLDGEIRDGAGRGEPVLVRQPVALFRLSYLHSLFGAGEPLAPTLTKGVAPSVQLTGAAPLRGTHAHLFEWDVMRRMAVVTGAAAATPWEVERFTDWYDKFGDDFVNADGTPCHDRLPLQFVPATVRILAQLFTLPDIRARLNDD